MIPLEAAGLLVQVVIALLVYRLLGVLSGPVTDAPGESPDLAVMESPVAPPAQPAASHAPAHHRYEVLRHDGSVFTTLPEHHYDLAWYLHKPGFFVKDRHTNEVDPGRQE